MFKELYVIETPSQEAFRNLALEELLLEQVQEDQIILYLWQNKNTVVIGKNQNAYQECNLPLMGEEQVTLARRLSGGGAVYHDLGNLNFTFIMAEQDFDLERQTKVLLEALQLLGLKAERSGRNDLTLEGRKFSGHAYYHSGGKSYHHGTLMVAVDMEKLGRYLQVSPLKLQAKGVESVRSRVCNLKEFSPQLTMEQLKLALKQAFSKVYGGEVKCLEESRLDLKLLAELQERYASEAWRLGPQEQLPLVREARFDWGLIRLAYELEQGGPETLCCEQKGLKQDNLKQGCIKQIALWTDALNTEFFAHLPRLLKKAPLEKEGLLKRLGDSQEAQDIIGLLLKGE